MTYDLENTGKIIKKHQYYNNNSKRFTYLAAVGMRSLHRRSTPHRRARVGTCVSLTAVGIIVWFASLQPLTEPVQSSVSSSLTRVNGVSPSLAPLHRFRRVGPLSPSTIVVVHALSDDVQKQMRGLSKGKKRKGRKAGKRSSADSQEGEKEMSSAEKEASSSTTSLAPDEKIVKLETSAQEPSLKESAKNDEIVQAISDPVSPPPVVTVIGATGGVGKECVRLLKGSPGKFRVKAIVRNKFGEAASSLLQYLGPSDLILEADVTKPSTLYPALEDSDFIIFAAGAGVSSSTSSSDSMRGVSEGEKEEKPSSPLNALFNAGSAERIPEILLETPSKLIDAVAFGGFEKIDNRGVANVAAIASGISSVKRIVLISSLGVTRFPIVQLATLAGDVLSQKRKGEEALASSGVRSKATGVARGYRFRLVKTANSHGNDCEHGSISRSDVARACLEVISRPEAALDSTFEIVGDASGLSKEEWASVLSNVKADVDVKSPVEEVVGYVATAAAAAAGEHSHIYHLAVDPDTPHVQVFGFNPFDPKSVLDGFTSIVNDASKK
eukprot:jgi/Bigna1/68631/fgenesh1_pg.6_\